MCLDNVWVYKPTNLYFSFFFKNEMWFFNKTLRFIKNNKAIFLVVYQA